MVFDVLLDGQSLAVAYVYSKELLIIKSYPMESRSVRSRSFQRAAIQHTAASIEGIQSICPSAAAICQWIHWIHWVLLNLLASIRCHLANGIRPKLLNTTHWVLHSKHYSVNKYAVNSVALRRLTVPERRCPFDVGASLWRCRPQRLAIFKKEHTDQIKDKGWR